MLQKQLNLNNNKLIYLDTDILYMVIVIDY